MHCTEIPAEDYFPTLEQLGKQVVNVLGWLEGLGY
jgi:hypothetical protein